MRARSALGLLLRLLLTILLAAVGWAVLGYFASAPLAWIFGWSSGHPPIPAAPKYVYVGLYVVFLPLVCCAGAWKLFEWAFNRIDRARKPPAQAGARR